MGPPMLEIKRSRANMGEGVSLSLPRNGFPVGHILVIFGPFARELGLSSGSAHRIFKRRKGTPSLFPKMGHLPRVVSHIGKGFSYRCPKQGIPTMELSSQVRPPPRLFHGARILCLVPPSGPSKLQQSSWIFVSPPTTTPPVPQISWVRIR